MLTRRALLLSLLSVGTVSGCGYQLRGFSETANGQLPYRLVLVTSQNADAEIVSQVKRVLVALGATLVSDAKQAQIEVILGATSQTSATLAIGAYGEISARLYVMQQPIQVRKTGQEKLLIETVVRRSREVDQSLATQIGGLGAERPLAITRESEEVLVDIRARIVDGVVRVVQSLVPLDTPL